MLGLTNSQAKNIGKLLPNKHVFQAAYICYLMQLRKALKYFFKTGLDTCLGLPPPIKFQLLENDFHNFVSLILCGNSVVKTALFGESVSVFVPGEKEKNVSKKK